MPATLECPVFYPTLADLNNGFEAYIENKCERRLAKAGIAKIVPPKGWTPRAQGYEHSALDVVIDRPIKQHATGSRGLYRALLVEQKPMTLQDFAAQAQDPDNLPGNTTDPAELERKYWRSITLRPPLYGADVQGSFFDENCKGWNLRNLDTVLTRVLKEKGFSLPGVNEPYLYFGQWRSTFAWHTEDMDLYSINYLHYGAHKQWYCIPPAHRARFESVVSGLVPDLFRACPEFLRHKELIISPQLLDHYSIPYIKVVQQPRDFIINFPGAYHAGFNAGYNCAESVNFATRKWIPLGAVAGVCECNPDSVSIDMRLFRHLVPARLLPQDIFIDSDSEEEDEQEDEREKASRRASGNDAGASASDADQQQQDDKAGGSERPRKRSRTNASTSTPVSRSGQRQGLRSGAGGPAAGRSTRGSAYEHGGDVGSEGQAAGGDSVAPKKSRSGKRKPKQPSGSSNAEEEGCSSAGGTGKRALASGRSSRTGSSRVLAADKAAGLLAAGAPGSSRAPAVHGSRCMAPASPGSDQAGAAVPEPAVSHACAGCMHTAGSLPPIAIPTEGSAGPVTTSAAPAPSSPHRTRLRARAVAGMGMSLPATASSQALQHQQDACMVDQKDVDTAQQQQQHHADVTVSQGQQDVDLVVQQQQELQQQQQQQQQRQRQQQESSAAQCGVKVLLPVMAAKRNRSISPQRIAAAAAAAAADATAGPMATPTDAVQPAQQQQQQRLHHAQPTYSGPYSPGSAIATALAMSKAERLQLRSQRIASNTASKGSVASLTTLPTPVSASAHHGHSTAAFAPVVADSVAAAPACHAAAASPFMPQQGPTAAPGAVAAAVAPCNAVVAGSATCGSLVPAAVNLPPLQSSAACVLSLPPPVAGPAAAPSVGGTVHEDVMQVDTEHFHQQQAFAVQQHCLQDTHCNSPSSDAGSSEQRGGDQGQHAQQQQCTQVLQQKDVVLLLERHPSPPARSDVPASPSSPPAMAPVVPSSVQSSPQQQEQPHAHTDACQHPQWHADMQSAGATALAASAATKPSAVSSGGGLLAMVGPSLKLAMKLPHFSSTSSPPAEGGAQATAAGTAGVAPAAAADQHQH